MPRAGMLGRRDQPMRALPPSSMAASGPDGRGDWSTGPASYDSTHLPLAHGGDRRWWLAEGERALLEGVFFKARRGNLDFPSSLRAFAWLGPTNSS